MEYYDSMDCLAFYPSYLDIEHLQRRCRYNPFGSKLVQFHPSCTPVATQYHMDDSKAKTFSHTHHRSAVGNHPSWALPRASVYSLRLSSQAATETKT
eukprot:CCRYP_002035-RB/>CCRYP_002035-RB protein AED:0.48 eAED:1.00 QI:0/0/0/1/0/0/2/0/96